MNHPQFRAGNCDTGFIADNPELLHSQPRTNSEGQVLRYLGNLYVNGNRGFKPEKS